MITGATAGIGEATAKALAEKGFDLIITGRRKERLSALENEISKKTGVGVLSLSFDVRKRQQVKEAVENLPSEWKNIDILVNNAGLAAGLSHIHDGDYQDWEQMIDTNIKGLLYVTREVTPGMVERKSGHIVNIASVAGKEVYEKGNVYCATKHSADALSKAMRIDLAEHNIKVTNIAPGLVDTEFSIVRFKGDKEKASGVYQGLIPLYAEDVADAVVYAVTRPPHVNINDLHIMPTAQATTYKIVKK